MAKVITLTPTLGDEYRRLFDTCVIHPSRLAVAEKLSRGMQAGRARYERITAAIRVPWYVTATLHALETVPPLNFSCHLHNGDPLTARTVRVPAGRPNAGNPPFTWEASAIDALSRAPHRLDRVTLWTLSRALFEIERFNGFGYRQFHPTVLSPYLWAGSQHYRKGKYVDDGTWDAEFVSKQTGAVLLLKRLVERGSITIE